jgi:hypothetical protein
VGVAAGLAAAAWRLHHARPHWWRPIAVLAEVSAWAVVLFSARWRFPTIAERVYAAITIYVAGIWLSAATAVGPKVTPLPQALAIGAVILSVPALAGPVQQLDQVALRVGDERHPHSRLR